MKKSSLLTWFTVFNFIGILAMVLFCLPSSVVFNINAKFEITEYITKWYNIVLPVLAIIACIIILGIDIKEQGNIRHVYRYLIAYVAVAVCSYYSWVLIGIQHFGGAIGDKITAPWTMIILFPIAYFMLANGVSLYDRMYKDKSLFKMDMTEANPMVWQKTHAMAGRMSIFTGLTLFVLAVLNEFIWHTLWIYLVAFLVWFVFGFIFILIYTRIIAREYEAE